MFSVTSDVVIDTPSPNKEPRRAQWRDGPDMVVLHYTGMESAEAALTRLCDPAAKVSAHYMIDERGVLYRLVDEASRAWHAGVASWRGETDINSRSIGVEIVNMGHEIPVSPPPFSEPQMARLERLLDEMTTRWSIEPEMVVGHSDVAPGRKIDPGEKFDWRRLARQGLAADWPLPVDEAERGVSEEAFRAAALGYGYGEWPTKDLLDAVRRRFRPTALGSSQTPKAADILSTPLKLVNRS